MKQNQTVITVEIKRGLISSLKSNRPNTTVVLIDHDNQDAPTPDKSYYVLDRRRKVKGSYIYIWD
jgi:hypothetical protein